MTMILKLYVSIFGGSLYQHKVRCKPPPTQNYVKAVPQLLAVSLQLGNTIRLLEKNSIKVISIIELVIFTSKVVYLPLIKLCVAL